MRKLIVILIALATALPAFSQTTTPPKSKKKKINLGNRAGDHFMLQLSRDSWTGAADTVSDRIKGFSKGFNTYLMLDHPFKADQRFSAAIGLGVSTSNIGFKKTIVDISANTPYLPFMRVDTLDHYKKYKLTSAYLELPVEIRFTANPERPAKTLSLPSEQKWEHCWELIQKEKRYRIKMATALADVQIKFLQGVILIQQNLLLPHVSAMVILVFLLHIILLLYLKMPLHQIPNSFKLG